MYMYIYIYVDIHIYMCIYIYTSFVCKVVAQPGIMASCSARSAKFPNSCLDLKSDAS